MKVTLLGTGGSAGLPMIGGPDGAGAWGAADPQNPRNRRTRASILIEDPGGAPESRLLVDTGPDLREQLIAARIGTVAAILYTHAHADHVAGIDDVRILNRNGGRPLDAYMTTATEAELRTRFDYAFQPWDGRFFFRPSLVARPIAPWQTRAIAGHQVIVFPQDHGFMETLGLRIGRFAYSTDVVTLDEAALDALRNVDVWVVDCFLVRGPHKTHAWVDRVLSWVDRIRPERTILTHLGPEMDDATLRGSLPPGVEPGYDGMVLTV